MNIQEHEIASCVRKLNRFECTFILEGMGLSMKDKTKNSKTTKSLLERLAKADPVTFAKWFEVIHYKRIPEESAQEPNALSAQELLKLVNLLQDHATALDEQYSAKIDAVVSKLTSTAAAEITKKAEVAIEKAKSQFITHQVKVGTSKPRKLSSKPPKEFEKILQLAQARINIMMVGPSGCGKTHIAGMLAEALGMDFAAQSCSVGVSESNFVGWLLPTGNGGKFNHVVSSFLRIYENGGVFLIDEIDNADPNLLVFLNMALANSKFYLPQRFDNPEVKKHPDFICIAAANTFGQGADMLYNSRNALDAATLDRFRLGTVEMDYDEDVEDSLIDNKNLLKWARLIRSEIKKHGLAKLMSTRALIDANKMVSQFGWTLFDCEKSYFADWSREEKAMIASALRQFHESVQESE